MGRRHRKRWWSQGFKLWMLWALCAAITLAVVWRYANVLTAADGAPLSPDSLSASARDGSDSVRPESPPGRASPLVKAGILQTAVEQRPPVKPAGTSQERLRLRATLKRGAGWAGGMPVVYLGLADIDPEDLALHMENTEAALTAVNRPDLLHLAQVRRWRRLSSRDTSLTVDEQGQLRVATEVEAAAVYHLRAVELTPPAMLPVDQGALVYFASASRRQAVDGVVDLGDVLPQQAAMLRFALADVATTRAAEAPAAQWLDELTVRLSPQQAAPDWLLLHQARNSEWHSDFASVDTATDAAVLEAAPGRTRCGDRGGPWWRDWPLSCLLMQSLGPVRPGQTIAVQVSVPGLAQAVVHTQTLQAGWNTLMIPVAEVLRQRAAQVSLQVHVQDGRDGRLLTGVRIHRQPGQQVVCTTGVEERPCIISHIPVDRVTTFTLEAPQRHTMPALADGAMTPQSEPELPVYPQRTTVVFDPLDHQAALERGDDRLSLNWLMPRYRWLRVVTRHPAAAGVTPASGPYPTYRLQRQTAARDWHTLTTDHFIPVVADDPADHAPDLLVSIERAGRYRVIAALDALTVVISRTVAMPEAVADGVGLVQFEHRLIQAHTVDLSALKAVYGLNGETPLALHCADYALMPMITTLADAISRAPITAGCQAVVVEWVDTTGETRHQRLPIL